MRFKSLGMGLLLCVLACPGAALAQGAWPDDCKLVRMAELPLSFQSGHVMVPAQVNGKPVSMMVDTGATITALTKPTVADLRLVSHRQDSRISFDIAGHVAEEYVRVGEFRLDHLERGGVFFSVIDPLSEAGGLIGADVLRNYDADFDFAAGTLNLFRHHPCADRAVYWTGSYAAIPVTTISGVTTNTIAAGRVIEGGVNKLGVLNSGHIRVPITLDGQQVFAIIDTGAPLSVISMDEAQRLFGLSAASADVAQAGKIRGGAGGMLKSYDYPFKTLAMGAVTVTNPRIKIAEGRNFLDPDLASVLLGMDVLQKLHLYIAYGEGKLYATAADGH